ncbi:hypothetical protein AY600_03940 [Phormidium willei BDU 130791]|nr:hypothetical protein AY600_03940 [Phormidium willei BDU 130791]
MSLFWGLGILVLSVGTLASPALGEFVPPDRGTPGRLEGAGTRWSPSQTEPRDQPLFDTVRGSCASSPDVNARPLTLLVPPDILGITLQEYPRFFVYVPPLPEEARLEFAVTQWEYLDGEQGEEIRDREVYVGQVSPPEEGGILPLQLPQQDDEGNSVTPLAVGQDYTWFVRILCNPESPTSFGPDIWREAWVTRLAPTPEFAAELEDASLSQQVGLLAETGVWYDALDRLAELRSRADEDESNVEQRWQQFLDWVESQ